MQILLQGRVKPNGVKKSTVERKNDGKKKNKGRRISTDNRKMEKNM